MTRIHSAAAVTVGLLAALGGCRSTDGFGLRGQITAQGLEQSVQLIPAQPDSGQEVHIVSVVANRSAHLMSVESRICGLDITGNVALVVNYLRCAGYSRSVDLAPGDTVTGTDMRIVASAPGQYTVRLRQLVQPEVWVDVPVVVH